MARVAIVTGGTRGIGEAISIALKDMGVTVEQVQEYVAKHPRFGHALHKPPHRAGSTSADLIYEVGELITSTRAQRVVRTTKRVWRDATAAFQKAIIGAPETARSTAAFTQQGAKELLDIAKEQGPGLAQKGIEAAKSKAAQVLPFKREARAEVRQAS